MDLKSHSDGLGSKALYPRHEEIIASLSARELPTRIGNAIVVSTDVLLPSNVTCVVVLEGGAAGHEITASDAGAALSGVGEVGLEITAVVMKAAQRVAQTYGLSIEHGVLRSPPEPISEARYLVLCMANAMAAVASAALSAAKKNKKVRYRERIHYDLLEIFSDERVTRSGSLQGFSQDPHKFDFVIDFSGGRKLALDVPLPDVSSIAAVVLRQADMRAAGDIAIKQAIAYDRRDLWKSSDLAQLQLAQVPLVASDNLRSGLFALSH